jgi:glutaredoxin
MVRKLSETQGTHPIRSAFNSAVEAAATLVPLVAIIAGIGMMRTLPPNNLTPLFESKAQAQAFFSEIQVPWDARTPIVLSSAQCSRCDRLREDLQRSEIPFYEHNIAKHEGASRLWAAAQKVTRNETLPVVIIGTQIVTPRARTIQAAILKADRSQETVSDSNSDS